MANDSEGNPPAGETNEERSAREGRERAENALMARIRKESKEAAGEAIKEAFTEWAPKLQQNSGTEPRNRPNQPKSILDIVLGR